MSEKRNSPPRRQSLHLPLIAPKDDGSGSPGPGRRRESEGEAMRMPVRVRLPPRSRTGCWTCRGRKVKCDEGRPTCGQCARLGHQCDYSPRLAFRDDTSRVLERMQEVSVTGNSVWDRSSPNLIASSPASSAGGDALPPFATLTSDTEREMKAESYTPGTYHVVVNPDSFASLPEYAEDAGKAKRSASRASNVAQRERLGSVHSESGDPNVVILPRFEEPTNLTAPSQSRTANRLSPAISRADSKSPDSRHQSFSAQATTLEQIAQQCGADPRLLVHFREVVWKHLVETAPYCDLAPHGGLQIPGADIFEREAVKFRPLFHAIMAVSALSLARHEQGRSVDALQHYQETLPFLQTSMRSHQDLSSNGVFLTHFLLLVYEIAAAEPGGSNLWSHHLERLLRIFVMRHEIFNREEFPFVIWWVCCIDLYALFSGAGSGEFVGMLLKNDMIPTPNFHAYPVDPGSANAVYSNGNETLPRILRMNYEVFILAARLGLLASECRRENLSPTYAEGSLSPHAYAQANREDRAKRLYGIQQSLKQLWESSGGAVLEQQLDFLPPRSKELVQHSSALFHACIIYSYTSMWPSQGIESGGPPAVETEQRVTAILRVGSNIVNSGRFDLRSIVFPLFMAGVATSSGSQKMLALELITSLENNEGVGRNTTTTRHVLQVVYQRQTECYMRKGHALDVDWMEVMVEQGLQMVNFGL